MTSLTLNGIPEELLEALRDEAERERRSLNRQAIYLLEHALRRRRSSFLDRLQAFYDAEGLPESDEGLDELRDSAPGRDTKL